MGSLERAAEVTMRTPTPAAQQLDWWRARLNGEVLSVIGENECLIPQPGYYKIRAKAWSKTWLPARVWLLQEIDWSTGELTEPERPQVEIAGRVLSDRAEGSDPFSPMEQAWMRMRPVTLDEWKWLTARMALHSIGTTQPIFMSA
jgi:hypothetical protein